jgi:F-type H+-transporting ATPase subunit b
MPQFNATLVFVLLSFVIFMLLMKAVFFDPMLKVKAQRERQLELDSESARKAGDEAERLTLDYESAVNRARREAQHIIQQIRQDAKTKAASAIAQARQTAQADLERQLGELAQWREATYQNLESERVALKEAIIRKITEHRPVVSPSH